MTSLASIGVTSLVTIGVTSLVTIGVTVACIRGETVCTLNLMICFLIYNQVNNMPGGNATAPESKTHLDSDRVAYELKARACSLFS